MDAAAGEPETAATGGARAAKTGTKPASKKRGTKSAKKLRKKLLRDDVEERMRRRELMRRKKLRMKRRAMRERQLVRPSPPLEETDPIGAYLNGEMVPCPVGCGGFSEVVRIATLPSGAGEVWFECLSCAQRKMFEVPAATKEEDASVQKSLEEGREAGCFRHGERHVGLRRRGPHLVCPECGVQYH